MSNNNITNNAENKIGIEMKSSSVPSMIEVIKNAIIEANKEYPLLYSAPSRGYKHIFFFNMRRGSVDYHIETGHIENRFEESPNMIVLGEAEYLCDNVDCKELCEFNPHVMPQHKKDTVEAKECFNKRVMTRLINDLGTLGGK